MCNTGGSISIEGTDTSFVFPQSNLQAECYAHAMPTLIVTTLGFDRLTGRL